MKTDQPILAYLLFTLFVGLKITGQIEWSWLWVFAPLWIYIVATIVGAFVIALVKVGWMRLNTQKGKGG